MSVLDLVRDALPGVRSGSRGWVSVNCPACGDRKHRGRFLETPTGGLRYMCYNGGCEFTSATRWEPDDGFIGRRVRQLYELLGGDSAELKLGPAQQMTLSEWIKWMLSDK